MASGDLLPVIFIAIGLSADCFAVALSGSISSGKLSLLQVFRVSASFGVFQGLMPLLGWLAGRVAVGFISGYDHWLAFALLLFVGSRMLWESFHSRDVHRKKADITKGFTLIILSVATSLDALAVGLTFALLKTNIIAACLIIGIIAFVITFIGFRMGGRLGMVVGRRAEALGGLILIGIGFKILLEHLL